MDKARQRLERHLAAVQCILLSLAKAKLSTPGQTIRNTNLQHHSYTPNAYSPPLYCSLHAGSGSAIIVTSRINQVASIMGTLPPHQISLLDEDQSWKLFRRNTFGRGVEKQEELILMAKSIVHKCKGLPLAIKTIAALLRSKHRDQWVSVLKEILAPRPRTILVFQRKIGIGIHPSMAKSTFVSLRALKTFSFGTNMTGLKHLRYLDCSYSDISALPEAITMMYSLQTLKLIGSADLKKLPEDMRYMSSLRHIFLIGCDSLERMPQGIGQLNSLQTLTNYVIDSDAGRGIDQLKDLSLGGALCLTELRKVHSAENAKQGNMSAKHNLKRLLLDWEDGPSYVINVGYEVDTKAEGILEALCPHKSLEVLLLSNCTGAKLSSWMHNSALLEHLSELRLGDCKNCKDLPPLWRLPSLAHLGLDRMPRLKSICVGNDDTSIGESCLSPPSFFPKLETMIVTNMDNLERWHQEVSGQVAAVSFPQLKKLKISRCPRLITLPEGLVQQLPALEEIWIVECPNLEGAFSRGGAYWNLIEGIPYRPIGPYWNWVRLPRRPSQ